MSIAQDLKVLYHLTLSPIRGRTHAERLESFYSGQADNYDSFRKRLLSGREELYASLPVNKGDVWVDVGAGTGSNATYFGDRLADFSKGYLVDLSPSLLEVAERRAAEQGWNNIVTVEADATTFTPPEGQADLVTFSYSLSMIPDWFAAVDNALRFLKPGGTIGIVDFYIARKFPAEGRSKHGWCTRFFWPNWFAFDNVFLSPDYIPYVSRHFDVVELNERRGKVPYIPFGKVPYYQFVGRKPLSNEEP
ncbi:Ubiquinone/menaquinone biosynthesis C-methyltransferase UbiE [Planctomycetes bacterium Pan216]|uniref:Ubiquinone/menaquinone biosynthesis C-methyltransferase UbiE n=1 Tax=Kolteria novifilia TaxID=2527975 RepID=A0A518BCC3_9BACT|nr:Ubiquinone/menaquinone biosynthesis C-methyltransferase UbiE [Planctomycetes bacterium Pan216]